MPPEHGIIRYSNGNKFSSRATYECDQGYVLEGAKHRDCQGNQEWGPNDVTSYCTKEGNVLIEHDKEKRFTFRFLFSSLSSYTY